jgi:hypothetical protein
MHVCVIYPISSIGARKKLAKYREVSGLGSNLHRLAHPPIVHEVSYTRTHTCTHARARARAHTHTHKHRNRQTTWIPAHYIFVLTEWHLLV